MKTTWVIAIIASNLLASSSVVAQECEEQEDVCIDLAESRGDACWDTCDARFPRDFDRWDACTDACSANEDRAVDSCYSARDRCEAPPSRNRFPLSASRNEALFGARGNGEDGCYFGECPDGIPSDPRPPEEQSPVPPKQSSPQPQFPPPQQQRFTAICQTPTFWCRMFQTGPVGYPCYCNSGFGPVNGVTVPQ